MGIGPLVHLLRKTGGSVTFWVVVLFGLFGVPWLHAHGFMGVDKVTKLGLYLGYAIMAVGLDLVWGYSGVMCLCQMLFFTLGGYAMGMYLAMHGPRDEDVPRSLYVVTSVVKGFKLPWFWQPFESMTFAIVAGLTIPGLLALLVGYLGFKSRVRGVYFAILTQALTLAAWNVFCLNNMRLCGTNGLTNFTNIAGWDLTDPRVKVGLYIITILVFLFVYFLCRYIVCSRMGRVLIAIRDNESRLRFSGYRPHYFKIFVFVLSAMIAGLAGMIYTPQASIMTPSYMTVERSILVVIWVAVGGRGSLSGAAVGALAVNLIYDFLTTHCADFWPFVEGGLFVGAALMFPMGMRNIRGILFLGWLLASPPMLKSLWWQDVFSVTDLSTVPFWQAASLVYYFYWLVWFGLGALIIWLVSDPERIDRPLRALWGRMTGMPVGGPAPDPAVQTAAITAATPSETGAEAAIANEAEESSGGEDIKRRLSRVSMLQRGETAKLPNSDLLKIENVQVVFDGFKALDVEAFSLGFYELRVIIGPNGAGKTTLCDAISGKSRAATGRIHFAGRDVTSMPEIEIARLGVGRKFQTPTVFDSLTVFQNMELALPGRQGLINNLVGRTTAVERERIDKILKRVRLYEHLDRQVKYLSHGQRQWLEISMLILAGPMLLLVDEPAAGLTDEETVLTAELLLELQDEHSIIVIEHDMDFVRLLASRVTVLNEGRVMADGTLDQVQANPEVIEAYLGR
jgi:urea transport system permease protein